MSKLSRKLKRSRLLKNRKQSKKIVKNVEAGFDSIPTSCTSCNKKFDIVKDANSWMLEVFSESSECSSRLLCPECYERTNEL